ncbi:MAG: NB-ARC domain-containing protein [Anaerolineae bacterium]
MPDQALDEGFIKDIHTALKRYHKERELEGHPLLNLAAVTQRLPDAAASRVLALKGLLQEALNRLQERDAEAAQLLKQRFWQRRSVIEVARMLGLAHSTLYYRQERAIRAMARMVWEMDQEAQRQAQARVQHLRRNLPPPTYTQLFGVADKLAALRAALQDSRGKWLISVEGLGGLGKTALAREATEWAAHSGAFEDLVWETAKQEIFTWKGIQRRERPALTFEGLLDAMAVQLGYPDIPRMRFEDKRDSLKALLKGKPYLVVVDNLETAVDYEAIADQLWGLANPSKFLLTSRHRLSGYEHVHAIPLDELGAQDALAFIRYEGQERGIADIARAQDATLLRIHQVTGGNPLAIKLVIGQTVSLTLDQVLANLRQAKRGHDQFYLFIYWNSWNLLSEEAKLLLLRMPLLPAQGGTWEDLAAASGLDDEALERAIKELVDKSLLMAGGLEEKVYSIHRLTHHFVLSELV